MSVSKKIVVLMITGAVILIFNNCQTDVNFSAALPDSLIGEESTGVMLPEPPPVPTTVEMVKADCTNQPNFVKEVVVNFPKPRKTCEWNKNGNLGERNDYLQARIEQMANLDLPAGSTVCGMSFSFAKQEFLYDDHFLMTFDDVVLASSYNFSEHLQSINDVSLYDWSNIAGSYWDTDLEGTFCAGSDSGKSQCSWPDTDEPGDITMKFAPEVFYQIMALDQSRANHNFKFISIGDNDDKDCEHSSVTFQVNVSYIMAE